MVHRLIEWLKRPAAYGALALSYAGIIAAVAYAASVGGSSQDAVRAESKRADQRIERVVRSNQRLAVSTKRDFCHVVINVHASAVDRRTSEKRALSGTLDYLAHSNGEAPQLVQRIRQNLPVTRARVKDAVEYARATRPPASCKVYQKEPK